MSLNYHWQLLHTIQRTQHVLQKKPPNLPPSALSKLVSGGINNHEFSLHYQPKLNLRTSLLMGFEALIRWQHPKHGLLTPNQFLPQLEHNDILITLGEWVLNETLLQIQRWHDAGTGFHKVSINISGRHCVHPDFSTRIHRIMDKHPHIPMNCIEFEILESAIIDDLPKIGRMIDEFRAEGVHFSLDDFGTGYASLNYLKHLSINTLKIDRSFVCHMLDNPSDRALVATTISLAQTFHCEVVAEGVESLAQGHALMQLGCDNVQGYAIARPMPGADVPAWIAQLSNIILAMHYDYDTALITH